MGYSSTILTLKKLNNCIRNKKRNVILETNQGYKQVLHLGIQQKFVKVWKTMEKRYISSDLLQISRNGTETLGKLLQG